MTAPHGCRLPPPADPREAAVALLARLPGKKHFRGVVVDDRTLVVYVNTLDGLCDADVPAEWMGYPVLIKRLVRKETKG